MSHTRRALFGASLLALPGLALAQAPRGPNGGPIAAEHGHSYELVANGTSLEVVLMDGSRPMPSQGASGRLVVQSGGQTASVPLRPVAPNRLAGSLAAPLAAGARVVFTAQLADGHRLQGRFALD